MFRWVPGLQAISTYRRQWLVKDIVAGIVLTTLLVPQGMAYAELAGLPPITGLYTSILCLLGYAAFGPSRILVLGPDSSLGPMIAATILRWPAPTATRRGRSPPASMLAIMVAAIMIVGGGGQAGLHRPADLQADHDRLHERRGTHHLGGPAAQTLRVQGRRRQLSRRDHRFVQGLAHGEAVPAAAAVGIAGIALILVLQ
jgi:hypothetical protein